MDFYFLNNDRILSEKELLSIPRTTVQSLQKLDWFPIDKSNYNPILLFLKNEDQLVVLILQYINWIWEIIFPVEPLILKNFILTKVELLNIPGQSFRKIPEEENKNFQKVLSIYSNIPIDENFFYLLGKPRLNLSLSSEETIKQDLFNKYQLQCNIPYRFIWWLYHNLETIGGRKTLIKVAENGYLEVMKCLFNSNLKQYFSEEVAIAAAGYGRLETLKYLVFLGFEPSMEGVDLAIKNRHLETVYYLFSLGIEPSTSGADYAIVNGDRELFDYIFYNFKITATNTGIDKVAGNGDMKMFDYIYSLGIHPTSFSATLAAKNGNLEMLEYLISLGVQPNNLAANSAASEGHWKIVNYLEKLGIKSNFQRPVNK
jgi:hypothetical protein